MNTSSQYKTFFLLLGDFALFYLGLYLALLLRYQALPTLEIWKIHQFPFFCIHILWLLVFYIGGSYDLKTFVSYKKILERVFKTMVAASIIAVLIFYLIPGIKIAPKTNLFLDIIVVSILLIGWRRLFWALAKKTSRIKLMFFGASEEIQKFANRIKNNPHLGYEIGVILEAVDHNLLDLVKNNQIQLIVTSKNIMRDKNAAKQLYTTLPLGVSVIGFENFYETLVEKIPISLINEEWFLENLTEINKKAFEGFKRIFDISMTILMGIPSFILFFIIAPLIKVESSGPVFYKQKRVGKNGKIFEIVKFRTMVKDAEKNGAEWAKEKDARITKIGNLLRKMRLDELPQLWNVLKGEMSFIGPRPERPEFVKNLEKEIPHYAMRYLIKPGLSGWAQIKFPYGSSVQDAKEKLQYDLYYLKNRSIVLDTAIAAKTIFTMISQTGI